MAVWERVHFFRSLQNRVADTRKADEANDRALDDYRRRTESLHNTPPESLTTRPLWAPLGQIVSVINQLKHDLKELSHTLTFSQHETIVSLALKDIHEVAGRLRDSAPKAG